jgi:hypothetical protein
VLFDGSHISEIRGETATELDICLNSIGKNLNRYPDGFTLLVQPGLPVYARTANGLRKPEK